MIISGEALGGREGGGARRKEVGVGEGGGRGGGQQTVFGGEGGHVDEDEVVQGEGRVPSGLSVEKAAAVAEGILAWAGAAVARQERRGGAALRRTKCCRVLHEGGATWADEDEPEEVGYAARGTVGPS